MKRFDKRVKIGTRVLINGEWCTVKKVHKTRKWIETKEFLGSFQRGHIEKFSNAKA